MVSVYRDMAHDGGYRGDDAEQVARMLEEQHRKECEEPVFDLCPGGCGRTTDDPYGGPCSICWDSVPTNQEQS